MRQARLGKAIGRGAYMVAPFALTVSAAVAAPLPGGTLDPLTVPKYVTPLVIPPVMKSTGTANDYDIAVRQFQQQILPGGIWASLPGCAAGNCTLPATTIWSYGPAQDPTPAVAPDANSQFNYPAYTIENTSNAVTTVDWINNLVANPDACAASADPANDAACNFIPHITPVDRSLHWANPEMLPCIENKAIDKDCAPDPTQMTAVGLNPAMLKEPYLGPVPMVTHVHGAHVTPESDGYPEAWWLPNANNIPGGYATTGTLVNQYGTDTNTTPGVANFTYPNDQPSTTLWYHDHTLGMTRNNVYAGPAGFWLIRDPDAPVGGETGLVSGVLPGPAPVAGDTVLELNAPSLVTGTTDKRSGIREIPIVIQDRSFNLNGSLFYPDNRAFFEGLTPAQLQIPFVGDLAQDGTSQSDIAPIWNPEAFFNVMVVNGVSWPQLEVAPALYRVRLLNGSNSRFLNLALMPVDPATGKTVKATRSVWVTLSNGKLKPKSEQVGELSFYQIGAEQSLLPAVVKVETGYATPLPGDGTIPKPVKGPNRDQALLMGPAERADVILDFRGLPNGTVVQMFNTAPDAPFGGFPDVPADPATTGQVMRFVVNSGLLGKSDTDEIRALDGTITNPTIAATAPESLQLSLPDATDQANTATAFPGARDLALVEEESLLVCATIDPAGNITWDQAAAPDSAVPGTCQILVNGQPNGGLAMSVPFAPKAAVVGINGSTAAPTVTLWSDPIATNPSVGATETWELWNHTVDGHPIHLHLVKFKVVDRQAFDPLTGALLGAPRPPEATEAGWKDTVISYPGEVTRLNATFDIAGLYVWHCHIVEHEDNEMMVPYCVNNADGTPGPGCSAVP